ncbi:hypothetical protein BaRGS_00034597 [Batillaria attramentaria]|uniref:G-protein coupled receptors family 1 profile domain-containing protein n=1 Tax=Batillaria attramentaria TaxID=370345 RepID=A0ABD0JIA6_9CAEN|nr:hypothetical protein BaRGS_015599 [Batillaria attramentaria]
MEGVSTVAMSDVDCYTYMLSLEVDLTKYLYLPVVLLGIVGNVIVLWVWQADSSFSPSTFFIQYLALSDALYLAVCVAQYVGTLAQGSPFPGVDLNNSFTFSADVPLFSGDVSPFGGEDGISFTGDGAPVTGEDSLMREEDPSVGGDGALFSDVAGDFSLLFSIMSVHVTLALAVSRCVAVYRPLRVHLILSRRRVIIASVVIACWSLLFGGLVMGHHICHALGSSCADDIQERLADPVYYLSVLVIAGCLPLLLMAASNVALLVKVCRRDVTSYLSDDQTRASRQRTRRLTLGVVCITTTSLLAYPVYLSVIAVFHAQMNINITVFIVMCIGRLINLLSHSINVIFYAIFASEFRRLLVLRFAQLRGSCK